MVSRPILFSMMMTAGHGAAAAAASSPESLSSQPRNLRASTQAQAAAAAAAAAPSADGSSSNSSSEDDIPDIVDSRMRDLRSEASTISQKCLNTLAAVATDGKVRKDGYFVFTDGLANGYYTFNNVTDYSGLPYTNKFGFITLSCQCHAFGGRDNCCQGDRAKLVVDGIDIDDPMSMPTELYDFVADICATTMESIGDNVLPDPGELPTTQAPTGSLPPTDSGSPTDFRPSDAPSATIAPSGSPTTTVAPSVSTMPSMEPTVSAVPTVSAAPTDSPSASLWPSDTPSMVPTEHSPESLTRPGQISPPTTNEPTSIEPTSSPVKATPGIESPPGSGVPDLDKGNDGDGGDGGDGGLTDAAWAGIAIGAAAVITLLLYLMTGGGAETRVAGGEEASEDDDLDEMSQQEGSASKKELLAITANGEMDPDRPARIESPDATRSMTMSDMESIPSVSTKNSGANRGGASAYYANNSLLPGRPDEESILSSSDGPSFLMDEGGSVEIGGLNTSGDSSNQSLDQAIESGNWEAVAASAAAIVKRNEGGPPSPAAASTTSAGSAWPSPLWATPPPPVSSTTAAMSSSNRVSLMRDRFETNSSDEDDDSEGVEV